jgi:hypothetical protein
MKRIILCVLVILFVRCTSQKSAMNSWMGHPKEDMIAKWGPPTSTQSEGANGSVCTWVGNSYLSDGTTYYPVKTVYFDYMGIAYKWAEKNQTTPLAPVNGKPQP